MLASLQQHNNNLRRHLDTMISHPEKQDAQSSEPSVGSVDPSSRIEGTTPGHQETSQDEKTENKSRRHTTKDKIDL